MNQLESAEWWRDVMEGQNAVSTTVDEALPRLMANLDRACKGEQIGIQAILETLSRVQLAARLYVSANEPEREPADDAPVDDCYVTEQRAAWDERMGSMV